MIRVEGLNVYDVLRHARLVLTKAAVEALERRLSEEQRKARARRDAHGVGMNLHDVIRRPLVTEKSTVGPRDGQPRHARGRSAREQVRDPARGRGAVRASRSLSVRTMRMAPKLRRVGKSQGRKPEWKKALVRLAEGQSIEFFEGM